MLIINLFHLHPCVDNTTNNNSICMWINEELRLFFLFFFFVFSSILLRYKYFIRWKIEKCVCRKTNALFLHIYLLFIYFFQKREKDTNPEISAVPVVQFQHVTFDVRRSRRLPSYSHAIVFGTALFGDDQRSARSYKMKKKNDNFFLFFF